jgi:transcriptional regulator with XRE-family HTH domain
MKPVKSPRPKEIAPEHQELMKAIGEKIKTLRTEKGKGYIEMAKAMGISRNNYNLMELGKIYFKFSTLLHILEYHKISASDFFKDL